MRVSTQNIIAPTLRKTGAGLLSIRKFHRLVRLLQDSINAAANIEVVESSTAMKAAGGGQLAKRSESIERFFR